MIEFLSLVFHKVNTLALKLFKNTTKFSKKSIQTLL